MTRPTLASIVTEVPHWPPLVDDRSLFQISRQVRSRPEPAPTSEELERQAHQRGVLEGLASAQNDIAAAAAANEERLQQALSNERLRLLDCEGQLLASALVSAIASLEKSIVDQVVPVLRHVLNENLVSRAMTELSQILLRAATPDGAHKITITCSPELIAAVKSYLPVEWGHAEFVEGQGPNIQVVAGAMDMLVELERWRTSIAGADL